MSGSLSCFIACISEQPLTFETCNSIDFFSFYASIQTEMLQMITSVRLVPWSSTRQIKHSQFITQELMNMCIIYKPLLSSHSSNSYSKSHIDNHQSFPNLFSTLPLALSLTPPILPSTCSAQNSFQSKTNFPLLAFSAAKTAT
jgi:hypothetical protein